MRFKGKPGLRVFDYRTDALIGKFDDKGYMDVEDEALFERLGQQFKPVRQRKKEALPKKDAESSKGSEKR